MNRAIDLDIDDDDEDGYHTGNVVPLTRSARQPLRKGRLDESA